MVGLAGRDARLLVVPVELGAEAEPSQRVEQCRAALRSGPSIALDVGSASVDLKRLAAEWAYEHLELVDGLTPLARTCSTGSFAIATS